MKEDAHERAGRLIDTERVEGLASADREWLGKHLEECDRCRARLQATERAVRTLRSVTVHINPTLVSTAQLRVRLRARELREHESRMRALWVCCVLSWILGAVTAPLLWQGFAWVGHRLALPDAIWITSFVLWWLVPAALVGAVFGWYRGHRASENGYMASLPRGG
jgi:predicted anti-sigma-YlaC factor YlaD